MFLHVVSNWYMLDFGIYNHCNSRFSFHHQLISLHTFLLALSWNVLINVGWQIVLLLCKICIFHKKTLKALICPCIVCWCVMCLLNSFNLKVLKSHFLQGWGRINKASKHTSFKISKKARSILCYSIFPEIVKPFLLTSQQEITECTRQFLLGCFSIFLEIMKPFPQSSQ